MNTGLRTAIIAAGTLNALLPAAAVLVTLVWVDGSFALVAAGAFVALLTPHAPVMIAARYESVSRRGLISLLACVLVFGFVPAAGLSALLVLVGGVGFGALVIVPCAAAVLLFQLFAYGIAVRVVRGPKPTARVPAALRWV
jgi:hypothetical protein